MCCNKTPGMSVGGCQTLNPGPRRRSIIALKRIMQAPMPTGEKGNPMLQSEFEQTSLVADLKKVLWCFCLNPHCRPRYECSHPTRGVIKEKYN